MARTRNSGVNHPTSRTARQAKIAELLDKYKVSSQNRLTEMLDDCGFPITQATLSRDLDEMGARKVRGEHGIAYYTLDSAEDASHRSGARQEKFIRVLQELVVGLEPAGNICMLKTPAGGAQYVASHIDRMGMKEVVGCIAGDDTIFVLGRPPVDGNGLAELFGTLLAVEARKRRERRRTINVASNADNVNEDSTEERE